MVGPNRLVILLKAPRPGFVKTRLAAALGVEAATAAYRVLAEKLFRNLGDYPDVELRYAPDDAAAELRAWQRPCWVLAPQGAGDLGERLHCAFVDHFARGAHKVIVLGADCPEVTRDDVDAAFKALDAADVVLGPASDGGYWLIGLRASHPWMFRGICWSTNSVLAETLAKAADSGLSVARLRVLSDIDTVEDWHAWQGSLEDRR